MNVTIRSLEAGDIAAVELLTRAAFSESDLGYGGEVDIIRALRAASDETPEWVAEEEGVVKGHIMFSPAVLSGQAGMGLAPMAVAPASQGKGIGSKLVEAGLRRLDNDGCAFVIVLGHPDYYCRFGFAPADALGVRCQWPDIPVEAFMIRGSGGRALPSGEARYHQAFEAL